MGGKTDGTGSQSARWVLRATLGKSSDRGEPECFRKTQTEAHALARPIRPAGRSKQTSRSAVPTPDPCGSGYRAGQVRVARTIVPQPLRRARRNQVPSKSLPGRHIPGSPETKDV